MRPGLLPASHDARLSFPTPAGPETSPQTGACSENQGKQQPEKGAVDSRDLASPGRALATPPTAVEVGWDRPGQGSQPRRPQCTCAPNTYSPACQSPARLGEALATISHPGLSLRPSAPLPEAQSDGCLSSG